MKSHGHVTPNPDGSRARCGGPAICSVCALELAQFKSRTKQPSRIDRISDIDLKALREAFELNPRALFASEAAACLAELQQSRALVTELRALAERMRAYRPFNSRDQTTAAWLSEFDSLLSAHGAKAQTKQEAGNADQA